MVEGTESEKKVNEGEGGGRAGLEALVCDSLNHFRSATPSPTKIYPRAFTNDQRMTVLL